VAGAWTLGALLHTACQAATGLQERDELALSLRISFNVALRHGETSMAGELLHVPQAPPTCDTLRAARVMKVRRPECDAQPSILSEV
jgi:hypothetical protein